MTVCACGCGKEVPVQYNWHTKKYVQFIHGHNAIGRKLSEETKLKISMKIKGNVSPFKGIPRTAETKRKISDARSGENHHYFGKHLSEEHRKKLSEAGMGRQCYWQGKKLSEEHRRNVSQSLLGRASGMKGKKHSEEVKRKISLVGRGRILSEQTKKKISESRKGIIFAEEQLRNMSLSHKGKVSYNKGKHFSEESKRRMSESATKRFLSEEARAKQREIRSHQVFPKKDSSQEKKVQAMLAQLNIDFVKHQVMNISHKYQCDILIPSLNLVIEADGIYWHRFPYGKEIDCIRTHELKNAGYNVLRLWEFEIDSMNGKDLYKRIEEMII